MFDAEVVEALPAGIVASHLPAPPNGRPLSPAPARPRLPWQGRSRIAGRSDSFSARTRAVARRCSPSLQQRENLWTKQAGRVRQRADGDRRMTHHKIAVIAGDGIGKEVVPEGIRVLEAAAASSACPSSGTSCPGAANTTCKHGRMMPEDGLEQIRHHDAVFLGAVGFPTVPDHVSLWGLLIEIRRNFQQYANIRPVRLMPGIDLPCATALPATSTSSSCARTPKGEYSALGRSELRRYTEQEFVLQTSVFTRRGVDRIMRYAFELAGTRPRRTVTSATKSNGVFIAMPYWDERFQAMAAQLPGGGDRPVSHRHSDRAFCAQSGPIRRGGGVQPVRRYPF